LPAAASTTGKQNDWAFFFLLEKWSDFIQCRNKMIWKPGRGIDTLLAGAVLVEDGEKVPTTTKSTPEAGRIAVRPPCSTLLL